MSEIDQAAEKSLHEHLAKFPLPGPGSTFELGFRAGAKWKSQDVIQKLRSKLTKEPSDYNVGINNALLILDNDFRKQIDDLMEKLK